MQLQNLLLFIESKKPISGGDRFSFVYAVCIQDFISFLFERMLVIFV